MFAENYQVLSLMCQLDFFFFPAVLPTFLYTQNCESQYTENNTG